MKTINPCAAAVATLAALLLSGCARPDAADPAPAPEVADCDAGDLAKQETPDCGFVHNGRFVRWSWVTQGRTTPPAGWRAAPEKAAAQKPTAKPTRKPGATRTARSRSSR